MISKTTSNYSLLTEKTTGAWSVVFLFLCCTRLVNIRLIKYRISSIGQTAKVRWIIYNTCCIISCCSCRLPNKSVSFYLIIIKMNNK